MTTSLSFSKIFFLTKNTKLTLFSPVTLLGLLAVLFTFFLTASGETGYRDEAAKSKTGIKTGMATEETGSALMYEEVVRNADAIRSVLQ